MQGRDTLDRLGVKQVAKAEEVMLSSNKIYEIVEYILLTLAYVLGALG
jgi:hypothetical protein